MTIERRQFLTGAALLPGAVSLAQDPATELARGERRVRNPIGVSTYSFWGFRGPRTPIEDCIGYAADLGFDGVEILHRQMQDESNATLQRFKRQAHLSGLALMGFSIHQDFVSPDPAERERNVQHTLRCIELAYALGIPTLRLNTGRWGTIRSFDALMEARGIVQAP